ncbi:hypothetical protein LR48_Vigan09g123700 [Vigna angularis]|uniref:Uncharacterized protein n=1 Tax=Phaseolus angularis TaxID=3914 RepID=A0A0L9VC44_PHAAN|nr:hypothetical protein LR48_Vigan09g123700 [Vigna angularis]
MSGTSSGGRSLRERPAFRWADDPLSGRPAFSGAAIPYVVARHFVGRTIPYVVCGRHLGGQDLGGRAFVWGGCDVGVLWAAPVASGASSVRSDPSDGSSSQASTFLLIRRGGDLQKILRCQSTELGGRSSLWSPGLSLGGRSLMRMSGTSSGGRSLRERPAFRWADDPLSGRPAFSGAAIPYVVARHFVGRTIPYVVCGRHLGGQDLGGRAFVWGGCDVGVLWAAPVASGASSVRSDPSDGSSSQASTFLKPPKS